MIFIDRREPEELAKEIKSLGVEVDYPVHWENGDIVFEGNGEFGPGATIAIERKKLQDLINCIKDNRLAGKQLRGIWRDNDFDYAFLLAEGMWRCGEYGQIEHWGRKQEWKNGKSYWTQGWTNFYDKADKHAVMYHTLSTFIHSQTLRSRHPRTYEPLRLIRTPSLRESAAQIVSLYKNFTEKQWHEHHSHEAIHTAPIAGKGHGGRWAQPHAHDEVYEQRAAGRVSTVDQGDPTTLWRMAAQLPGILRLSGAVNAHFGTVRGMVLAGLDPELREIVDEWLDENREAVVAEWQRALGISKGRAKAEAAIRAISERGG